MVAKLISIVLVSFAAQGQEPKPAFEVATVKPAVPLGPLGMRADRRGGPGTADPGLYTCNNCPVYWVLSEAYDLQLFEYAGPGWVHDTRFDFSAKIPVGTSKDTFRLMLQNLLVERFKLVTRREKKEMSVYELTVARNGPRFRESVPVDTPKEDGPPSKLQMDKDGFPILKGGMTMAVVPGHARLRAANQPIAWLVRNLAGQLQSPVIDTTGLTGRYDFILSWAFEEDRTPVSVAGGAPAAAMVDPYRPALINAVQSQLGLKLEQKRGQAEVLAVDHIEKTPTGN